ncbi:MAG: TRAP transporter substrate-binding protein [Thermodesulfobacteriota bacterium]
MERLRLSSLILGLLVLCSLFFSSFSFGQTRPVELTFSGLSPTTHANCLMNNEWAKEIEKRTNGRVKITVFCGGTLTSPDKIYTGVVRGISDAGYSAMGYSRGKFPLTEVIDLPLGYKNGRAATKLINEYYRRFKPKEFDEVKVMYFHAHGPGVLHTKVPVRRLEDLKGLKIRCTGLSAKVVAALGGTPVAMPVSEAYDALSRGVVEGTMLPRETLEGYRLGEVVKYTTENFGSAYTTGFFTVMNKDKWNALPPDIQKIIEGINEEWIDKTGRMWDEIDKAGREYILKRGNQIISLSKEEDERWAKAVRPLLDDYLKDMKGKGLPGDDALKFCLNQLKKLQ